MTTTPGPVYTTGSLPQGSMYRLLLPLTLSLLAGCSSSWSVRDEDGDGVSILEGDCFDAVGGEGIAPGQAEVWYDGVDQNCDGLSDNDKDGDGFDSIEHGGDDCWDDPDVLSDDFEAINGFPLLSAATVFPGASEVYYDGVDQNCDVLSDFDQDLDGYDTSNTDYRQRDGSAGDDCYDVVDDPYPESGEVTSVLLPEDVHPDATDEWYDGTDQDCDLADDYDQDGDGFPVYAECDDTDEYIVPRDDVDEIWYNDVDENCDGNRYDKDLDGHDSDAYGGDDCWDDYDAIPTGYDAINGRAQPSADQVYPEAVDAPYDGVDGDCAGDSDFDADADGYTSDSIPDRDGALGDDCDDGEGSTYPDADEVWYDGIDSDCDEESDYDADGDGYDSEDQISTGTDCDDTRAAVNPAPATNENCVTSYDDNCDGSLDLLDATGCTDFYRDLDGDGYGDEDLDAECWCEEQTGTHYEVTNSEDCNDLSGVISPAEDEICDSANTDEDCDGASDNDDASAASAGKTRYYRDSDHDAYGDETHAGTLYCDDPTTVTVGWSSDNTDCDDASGADHPGATEIVGNQDDENCDGSETCYDDDDDDGYLDTAGDTRVSADTDCLDANEATSSALTTDCDDASDTDYPGATEIVGNEDDESCDGSETCYDDDDNDGYLDTTADTRVSADADCGDAYEGSTAELTTDCDDGSATDYPGATEIVGNGDDESCDGSETCYDDDDNDGYLDTSGDTRVSTDTDCGDIYEGSNGDPTTDCDDASSTDYPGASEIIGNEDDESCDGAETCYHDDDDDGFLDTTADTIGSADTDCDDENEGTSSDLTTDCDDGSDTDYPGATEIVGNGDDESCDGTETCYDDDDNDGYLDTAGDTRASTDTDCGDAYEGTSADLTTDCDDSSASDYPGATETVGNGDDEDCDGAESCYDDDDNDGFLDTTADVRASTDSDCDDAYEGTTSDLTTDCDDTSASDYPGATETVGNEDDEDCDGAETCYDDDDNDGFLDTAGDTRASTDEDCTDAYEGTTADLTTDCDDSSATDYPGATEIVGNGDDESCDGAESCYDDDDNDGFLDTTADVRASTDSDCDDAYEGTTSDLTTDCDDSSASDYPGATETVGNEDDEDCDGAETCYDDDDNDGFLDTAGDTRASADEDCTDAYEGTTADLTTDCDDSSATDYPGATEIVGNGDDEDCDTTESCYDDDDNDGYLDTSGDVLASADTDCADAYEGTNSDATTDCDDDDAAVSPGDSETCNGIDDDCDGTVDDTLAVYYVDADGDGDGEQGSTGDCSLSASGSLSDDDCDDADAYVYLGATEFCDGQLNDCADSGTWNSTFEDDIASFYSTTGAWSDVTTSFDSTSPGTIALTSGSYYLCDGNWYGAMVGSTNDDAYVIGRNGMSATTFHASSGSALTVSGAATQVTLRGLTITGGAGTTATGQTYGGAVYATDTALSATPLVTVDSCWVSVNSADYGGGVAAVEYASVYVTGSLVSLNTAIDDGGGIWVGTNAYLEVDATSEISSNEADNGGGICIDGSGDATLSDTTIDGNLASLNGGGLYFESGSVVMDNVDIDENSAVDGAGIWMDDGALVCVDGSVVNNTASGIGGGVFVDGDIDAAIAATTVDFGESTTDNTPSDVEIHLNGVTYMTYADYYAGASFACAAGTCSPASSP